MKDLYSLPTHLESRSVSFENISGAKGEGGKAASPLGPGRKGSPARMIEPGNTVVLADIEGPGMIRHMWMTTYNVADTMRGLVIRIYWEGQQHPSVEAPLGDFFGFAHGETGPFQTSVHSVGEKYALNIWLPMPFAKRARVTLSNDLDFKALFFYQIDYTIGDDHPKRLGRLHASFRRETSTISGRDFELLPRRHGSGCYLGSVIGVKPSDSNWWGEGEVKMFIDGDDEFPTIVGTGAEDYVGLSWGIQQNSFLHHGANHIDGDRLNTGAVSMYRWHIADPVFWQQDIRITVQQIGIKPPVATLEEYLAAFYEREDDWSACTFWYEPVPSQPVPPIPELSVRLHDLNLVSDRRSLPLQPDSTYHSDM